MTDVFTFLPILAIVFLANLGVQSRAVGHLTLAILGAGNAFVLLAGLILLNPGTLASLESLMPGVPLDATARPAGICLAITAVGCLLLLIPAVLRRVASRFGMWPAGPVDATALILCLDVAGLSIAQLVFLPYIALLVDEPLVTPLRLWIQGTSFVAVGFLGVGFPVRRGLVCAMKRLGLTWPTPRHLLWTGAGVAAALLLNVGLQAAWRGFAPEDFAAFEAYLETFFGDFEPTAGLLAVGLSAGVGEEILFRGALQPRMGLAATTLVFGVIHSYYGLTPAWLWIFVLGLGLGLLRKRANTTSCILFHAAYNGASFLVGT